MATVKLLKTNEGLHYQVKANFTANEALLAVALDDSVLTVTEKTEDKRQEVVFMVSVGSTKSLGKYGITIPKSDDTVNLIFPVNAKEAEEITNAVGLRVKKYLTKVEAQIAKVLAEANSNKLEVVE